jgi:hypothetical protein
VKRLFRRAIASGALALLSVGLLWLGVYALASLPPQAGPGAIDPVTTANGAVQLALGLGSFPLSIFSGVACIVSLGFRPLQ